MDDGEYRYLLDIIREQGEFIQNLKRQIADFTSGDAYDDFKRPIADRGLRGC